jgi:hypothetical protein
VRKGISETRACGNLQQDLWQIDTWLPIPPPIGTVQRSSLAANQFAVMIGDDDLGIQNPEIVSRQLDEVLQGVREQCPAARQSLQLTPID